MNEKRNNVVNLPMVGLNMMQMNVAGSFRKRVRHEGHYICADNKHYVLADGGYYQTITK